MSALPKSDEPSSASAPPPRGTVPGTSVRAAFRRGDPFIWLAGGGLALCLVMIAVILLLVGYRGLTFFWPKPLVELATKDGKKWLVTIERREATPGDETKYRLQVKIANRDLNGLDFKWFDEADVVSRRVPGDALLLERQEYGNFHGFLKETRRSGERIGGGGVEGIARLSGLQAELRPRFVALRKLERKEVGAINSAIETSRLLVRKAELAKAPDLADVKARAERSEGELKRQYEALREGLQREGQEIAATTALVADANGRVKELPVESLVRVVTPNRLSFAGKARVYLSRMREFVADEPRESNTEGGIFPAIFGTVLMVIIMSAAVVPFGVLAALYLREYAREGPLVRLVRVAVNNLAGVPSIVFGIFGLGFFVYALGGSLDRLFYPERLPTPTFGTGGILWCSLTLALLTVPVVIVATEEALAAVPRGMREASLALGATKWQTTWRIVVPAAAPGILTGLILAMARGSGEVAPLMIVGVVKLAPTLPLDTLAPYLHLERKIMHLGFHIYDVGFQSPNVEAALPMVTMTAGLLIALVVTLNLTAIVVRTRLRKKLRVSAF
jgi:phosphate transport system permease protein